MREEEPDTADTDADAEWMKEINFSIAFCHAFYCWLRVFRCFCFSEAATATRRLFPKGRGLGEKEKLKFRESLSAEAAASAASAYLVSVIWNASLTRKNCRQLLAIISALLAKSAAKCLQNTFFFVLFFANPHAVFPCTVAFRILQLQLQFTAFPLASRTLPLAAFARRPL